MIGRRGGGGCQLGGRGVAVSSSKGRGGEGGPRERSEWPIRVVVLGSGRRRWPARAGGGGSKGWRWSMMLQLGGGNLWREVRWHGRRGGCAQRIGAWRRRSGVVWRRSAAVVGREETSSPRDRQRNGDSPDDGCMHGAWRRRGGIGSAAGEVGQQR
jgi:hypothetical protein